MGKIIVLEEDVISKIAAGEVIERPASVVKELVDNSRDAEASCIRIELVNGGKDRITVIDDGCGMSQDDVFFAAELHTTSKITCVEDIYNLSTLGFRGEALSAIAGVSKFSLASKQKGSKEKGMKIEIEGGEIKRTSEWDGPEGTVVTCEDLFFEFPARRAFLKSAMSEYSYCLEYVQAMSLADPSIHYILTHNGKEQLNIPAYVDINSPFRITETILRQRASHIFGEKLIKDMLYFKVQGQYATIYGLLSPPGISKGSAKMIYSYVNKRWVNDKLIKSAILTGYHSHLPKGQYPIVVLYIDIDPTLVDVNVHPAKTEIRFQYAKEMYGFIASSIKSTIRQGVGIIDGVYGGLYPSEIEEKAKHKEKLIQEEKKLLEELASYEKELAQNSTASKTKKYSKTSDVSLVEDDIQYDRKVVKVSFEPDDEVHMFDTQEELELTKALLVDNKQINNTIDDEQSNYLLNMFINQVDSDEEDEDDDYDADEQNMIASEKDLEVKKSKLLERIQATYSPTISFDEFQFKNSKIQWQDLKFIGSMYKCYLIFENENGVLFVDQHAFHERIIYEKLMKKASDFIKKQQLMLPISFSITPTEAICLEEASQILKDLNFEYKIKNQAQIEITALPVILKDIHIPPIIQNICADIEQKYSSHEADIEKITHKILSTIACRSAIKAGEELDEELVKVLIKASEEVDFFHNCPHGRRVLRWFSKNEIEKWFGR